MLNREAKRFIVVGLFVTALNYAIFAVLFSLLHIPYRTAYAAGYVCALVCGFIANKQWTFNTKATSYASEGTRYVLVYTATMLIGLGVLSVLVELAGIHPLLANILTVLVTATLNFFGLRYVVFRQSKTV